MKMTQTDEERKAQIEALLEERRSCVTRGLDDRVPGIDAQLHALGAQGAPKAKRATKRKAG